MKTAQPIIAAGGPGHRPQRGFTLVELAIATVVLLVGVVAVMQLVPNAMQSNLRNRYDSSAVVIAQRLLDQMMSQPLSATQFTDADGRVIELGGVAAPFVGGPVQNVQNMARLNFNAPVQNNCGFTYVDLNDPTRPTYEVRWAVISTVSGGQVVAKRYIAGAWKREGRQVYPPVTVEGWVQQ